MSEKFSVVGGGGGWSSDNTVSKVQVLDSRLKTSDFGLDFGLNFGLGLWLDKSSKSV